MEMGPTLVVCRRRAGTARRDSPSTAGDRHARSPPGRGEPRRPAHGSAQPARLRGDARLRARSVAAHRPPGVADHRRDRRARPAQRRARARRRRLRAPAGRERHGEVEAPDRLGRTHRRREVRHAAPRDRRARRLPGGRAAAPSVAAELRSGRAAADDLVRRGQLPRPRRRVRRADGRRDPSGGRRRRARPRPLGHLLRRRRAHARRGARAGRGRAADRGSSGSPRSWTCATPASPATRTRSATTPS